MKKRDPEANSPVEFKGGEKEKVGVRIGEKGWGIEVINDPRLVFFKKAHVSSHASPRDLVRLCKAIKPKRIITVHTEFPHGLANLFPEVVFRRMVKPWNFKR